MVYIFGRKFPLCASLYRCRAPSSEKLVFHWFYKVFQLTVFLLHGGTMACGATRAAPAGNVDFPLVSQGLKPSEAPLGSPRTAPEVNPTHTYVSLSDFRESRVFGRVQGYAAIAEMLIFHWFYKG